ncbi:LPXTG cell wall anchor domain-containing protein [Streptococcus parauberis]|nr:LPXTG cell wall anchor domain-containing protein [Streptococcus parauberis]
MVRQLAAKTESLPTTGSQESQTISLFGFAFLSIGALFTRKNRRQN